MNTLTTPDHQDQALSGERVLYCLPGMGGRLDAGLYRALGEQGYQITGRETVGTFRTMSFTDQVATVAEDLQTHFWRVDARVLTNSFGSYLLLNALCLLPPFPARALILSPIVGEFDHPEKPMSFSPPKAGKIMQLATTGKFPKPRDAQIHVGEHDWQASPESVHRLGKHSGIPVTVVPKAGHMLPHSYVSATLNAWLNDAML
jgi:hypothetical protein